MQLRLPRSLFQILGSLLLRDIPEPDATEIPGTDVIASAELETAPDVSVSSDRPRHPLADKVDRAIEALIKEYYPSSIDGLT